MSTIQKILELNPVVTWDIPKNVPTGGPIMGIELELENIRDWSDWEYGPFIRKEDGSLRNSGSEFVSLPLGSLALSYYVEDFYKRNRVNASHISERCSVHVHLNCQDLSIEQVASLCKVYQVFERMLFNFVGDDRDKSIFCVPWHQTNITSREIFTTPLRIGNFKSWYKYTALNLLPLFSYGTIEFRHMAGQPSYEPIVQWINLIVAMRKFVVENTADQIENLLIGLNTTSQYDMLVDRVFGEYAQVVKCEGYKTCLEEGVLHLKYMLFENFHPTKKPLSSFKWDTGTTVTLNDVGANVTFEEARQRIADMANQFAARPDGVFVAPPRAEPVAPRPRVNPAPRRRNPL